MRELKIRCSALGRIMTEPKSKTEGDLSVGAKTYIREIAAQDLFGVTFEVSDKKLEKGMAVEGDSIELVNSVRGWAMTKNTERRSNEWVTGEADCWDEASRRGCDVKSAWSLQTFPISADDVEASQRRMYEWQMIGYCWLWDAECWSVEYAMVDTPEHLIGYEPLALHVVSHIPEHLRLTGWTVTRDRAKEDAIRVKVEAAREYYARVISEFDRTHAEPVHTADQ